MITAANDGSEATIFDPTVDLYSSTISSRIEATKTGADGSTSSPTAGYKTNRESTYENKHGTAENGVSGGRGQARATRERAAGHGRRPAATRTADNSISGLGSCLFSVDVRDFRRTSGRGGAPWRTIAAHGD
ncbi:hypothetical protein EVAR_54500_1 [Eumeta japonica]|uniref:Uncharacterized protein n=1 Tax=Eumeta variegata TaxID=151549 RepID=A0A4C1YLY9_EUMVA|nr:hypothetical protein EVAR_54500_1 [Eumeta japonica]